MSPETGRRFGPYEIQSRLGGGGMGHVYRAWDGRLHREVAIKLLNEEFAMPGMRERFLREARAASALNHPNICSIFDIGEQDGDPYLVMELLEGETLKDRIQNATLPVSEIICVARETAEALGAAHSKGVVHRDIKPANIFLVRKPNGTVQAKVLDFGLAKIDGRVGGGRSRGADLTSIGATVGTLAYMSPEQARGEPLDSRSDLFSLGVVMYEMATRQVPFQGATSALVFVQLLNHPPEPVRDWNESVPRELEKIIFKLLAKERTARPQTAHEVELALLAMLEKGQSGGWLRKAVSAVPLVRASDPVARKRTPSARPSGVLSPADGTRGTTPVPAAESSGQGTAANDVLRPVARVPRPEAPQVASVRPAAAQTPTATLSPVPPSRAAVSGQVLIQPKRIPAQPGTPHPRNAMGTIIGAREGVTVGAQAAPGHRENEVVPSVAAAPESRRSTPSLLEFGEEEPPVAWWLNRRLLLTGICLAALAVPAFVYYRSHASTTPLTKGDAIVVAQIVNQTGVHALDDSVSEGLRIAMSQSLWMEVRDERSVEAAERQIAPAGSNDVRSLVVARRAAERLGARAYVAGLVIGNTGPFLLRADLRDAKSNDVIVSADARAEGLEQVPAAIDRLAAELRLKAGEPRPLDRKTAATLAQEATGNLAALQLLTDAHSHQSGLQPLSALEDLRQAVMLDPHFTQGYLELASLYRQFHAETAASEAARLALASSEAASEQTQMLAQAAYEVNSSGDFARATAILRQLVALAPGNAEALSRLAEMLLCEGHLSEALQAAQQAYAVDPYQMSAYSEAEEALLALDRYDAAFQLQSQMERLGQAEPEQALVAAYQDNRPDLVAQISGAMPLGKMELRPDWAYGLYLDDAGHLAAGSTYWTSRADSALLDESLKSAGVFLLAQGAYNRALLGDCKAALGMEHSASFAGSPAGRQAQFRLGFVAAMCGDSAVATQILEDLEQQFPRSFEVRGFMAPNIRAALALHEGQPQTAIDALQTARPYDLISITPFLRGQAHVSHGDVEIGIVDLQTVLAHRGAAFIAGSSVYPAAQIAVARAFAGSGDLSNSAAAYARFLDMWRTADSQSPLVAEARLHAVR